MILLTPAVFAVFRDRKCRQNRGVYFLLAGFLVSAIIISNLQVFETRRYRVLLEPLFVALALWGSAYGRPERYARWIWPLFLVPAMLVWALNGVIQ
jgi:hypothetical protein